jgi:hypothetical protein
MEAEPLGESGASSVKGGSERGGALLGCAAVSVGSAVYRAHYRSGKRDVSGPVHRSFDGRDEFPSPLLLTDHGRGGYAVDAHADWGLMGGFV